MSLVKVSSISSLYTRTRRCTYNLNLCIQSISSPRFFLDTKIIITAISTLYGADTGKVKLPKASD